MLFVGFYLLLFVGLVEGATFCADTSEQLQKDLNTAAANGEDDVIQIVQGTYIGNFSYNSGELFGLTIEGGYSAGCSSRTTQTEQRSEAESCLPHSEAYLH